MLAPDLSRDEAAELPIARPAPFDPPPELVRMMSAGGLHRIRFAGPEGRVGWLVAGHGLAREVLADPRVAKLISPAREIRFPHVYATGAPADPAEREALELMNAGQPIVLDRPEHPDLRRRLAGQFSVKRVDELRDDVAGIVAEACDALEDLERPVDLVRHLAVPVPLRAICRFVGIRDTAAVHPPGDAEFRWAELAVAVEREVIATDGGDLDDLLRRLAARGDFTERELIGVGMAISTAGFHTTSSMIAAAVLGLLADRRHWERLCADPALIPGGIEELMRFLSIGRQDAHLRVALEDLELDGTVIAEGEWIYVSLPAANRDPRAFDRPDRLDLTRDASSHVMFGYGPRQCLGQNLVRLEVRTVLEALTSRFPGLRLAVPPDEVPLTPDDSLLLAPTSLPVTW